MGAGDETGADGDTVIDLDTVAVLPDLAGVFFENFFTIVVVHLYPFMPLFSYPKFLCLFLCPKSKISKITGTRFVNRQQTIVVPAVM